VQKLCQYLGQLGLPDDAAADAAASTNVGSSSTGSSSSSNGASPGAKGPALHKLLQQGNALEAALKLVIQQSKVAADVEAGRRGIITDAPRKSGLRPSNHEIDETERQLRLEAVATVTPQLLLQMKHFGEAVAAQLPLRFCCNNPRCMNASKLSELQLVRKPGSVCPHCKVARWCSKACLNEHWQQHLPVCKALCPRAKKEKEKKAAAAAAAAAPAVVQGALPKGQG
jgi:hypothetical protein